MEWRDQGALLSVRKHGETSVIIEVFTAAHGRHAGVVRGGTSRKIAPILQPGAQLDVAWRARLEDHLGAFTVEPLKSRAANVMGDRTALAALNAMTALLSAALPEREAHGRFYEKTIALLDLLGVEAAWPVGYVQWELALLEELGAGLDLGCCAVTGASAGLVYVSPKSGRAVSHAGAGDWADRLLPLTPEMNGVVTEDSTTLCAALRTTGFFLERAMEPLLAGRGMPEARARLVDRLARG